MRNIILFSVKSDNEKARLKIIDKTQLKIENEHFSININARIPRWRNITVFYKTLNIPVKFNLDEKETTRTEYFDRITYKSENTELLGKVILHVLVDKG